MATPVLADLASSTTAAPATATSRFFSPTLHLTTHGCVAQLPQDDRPLVQRLEALFAEARAQGVAEPLALGAIPFHGESQAYLSVPQQVTRAAATPPPGPVMALPTQAVTAVREWPDRNGYEGAVTAALQALQTPALRKVVLSRTVEVTLAQPLPIADVHQRLWQRNPQGYVFSLALGAAGHLLGASPELLVRRLGRQVWVNPLAGTTARHADPQADQAAAQALMASAKDLAEHAIVIEQVVEALRPLCPDLQVPDGPQLHATDALWHLSTPLSGTLTDPSISALELATRLHPTPAVCGTPTTAARHLLQQLEPFDRGYFAGYVGWCAANGDGEWAVTLRCAQVSGQHLRAYAGAGIVPGSDPSAEYRETRNKLRTFLAAAGLDHALPPQP